MIGGSMSLEKYLAKQRNLYSNTFAESNRALSAYHLAVMSLEHGSSSAATAASLLLSLEDGSKFNLQNLIKFDTVNRAHADLVILGCIAHDYSPSKWMTDAGYDGNELMDKLRQKWLSSVEVNL